MKKHAEPRGIQLPRQRNWDGESPELRERASYLLLDTIGAALAGCFADATRQVQTLMPRREASPLDTALLLGTACQALDLDETNLPARCHIAAAIVPALIGAAMIARPSGVLFMEALLAAYEFEARLGQALAPRHGARGWHPSATLGAFGAAYGASLLMGLGDKLTRNALVIAATQAAGVKAVFGGTAKPFNFGRAAQSGLIAALLARSGMTAPGDPFLSPSGFFKASGALPFGPVADGRHPLLQNHFKFLPYCIETHAAALAARELASVAEEPKALRIHLAPTARAMVDRPAPMDIDQARFSVQYVVALSLANGARSPLPEEFHPGLLNNSGAIEIIEDAALAHLDAMVIGKFGDSEITARASLGMTSRLDKDLLDAKFNLLAAQAMEEGHSRYSRDILALAKADDAIAVLDPCLNRIGCSVRIC